MGIQQSSLQSYYPPKAQHDGHLWKPGMLSTPQDGNLPAPLL